MTMPTPSSDFVLVVNPDELACASLLTAATVASRSRCVFLSPQFLPLALETIVRRIHWRRAASRVVLVSVLLH